MKVYEIVYEVEGKDQEITREICYWTAPSLSAASLVAETHAYQYDKDFISGRYVLTITQQLPIPTEDEQE